MQADEDADEVADGEAESSTVQCVTCGIGLTVRNAIRYAKHPMKLHTHTHIQQLIVIQFLIFFSIFSSLYFQLKAHGALLE